MRQQRTQLKTILITLELQNNVYVSSCFLKSERNPFKTRSTGKPIRMGWNILRLCDQGEITDGFCLDCVVQVGSFTFQDLELDEPYKYQIWYKFTHALKHGTTIVADNYFYCPKAMRAAKLKWRKKKRIVVTVPGIYF